MPFSIFPKQGTMAAIITTASLQDIFCSQVQLRDVENAWWLDCRERITEAEQRLVKGIAAIVYLAGENAKSNRDYFAEVQ